MTRCAHCDLPVLGTGATGDPDGPLAGAVYCCTGCLMVADLLGDDSDERTPEQRALLYRLFVGVLAAGFTMTVSVAIASGYGFGALRTLDTGWDAAHWALLAAALPALALLGPPVWGAAWRSLRARRLSLEVLFALGTLAAIAASAVSYARGSGPVYLETAAMLLALYTLGRYLDARTRGQTTRVLRRLLDVPTANVERLTDGGAESVSPEALAVGDRVRLRAGDVVPVDGVVEDGLALADTAALTGEATPSPLAVGDTVLAGTLLLDAPLVVRVTATGEQRHLARVEHLMHEAMAQPTHVADATDRAIRWLFPAVVVLAVATFAGWTWAAGFERGLYAGLAVVLIACPCALGLAVPLALHVALGEATRRSVLVRSGQSLLDLADIRAAVLDKTGTLAQPGRVVSVGIPAAQLAPSQGDGHAGLLPLPVDTWLAAAAAVEGAVDHPLARAIRAEAQARALALPRASDARSLPGLGVEATVAMPDGPARVAVGHPSLLALGHPARAVADRVGQGGGRALIVTAGRQPVALLSVEEAPTSGAVVTVGALRAAGLHVEIVSGDRDAAVQAFTAPLGVEGQGAATPEGKLDRVRDLQATVGPTLVLGDGTNDAAALAAADVGIALARGTALAVEAADVTLYGRDLAALPWLLDLAQRTRRTVRLNLVWTFGYNAVGLALAVAGLLHPLAAVLVMVLSSAFVTATALRLRQPEAP
ncbi:MAG: heavy metal translocating P-type ATPase [Sandaracinaceae bacterium]